MAINYQTLFGQFGSVVKEINNYANLASTQLINGLQNIVAEYGSGATTFNTTNQPILGVNTTYASFQRQVASFRRTLNQYATKTLTARDTVVSQLPITSSQLSVVMPALVQDMVNNVQTVKASVVTIGSQNNAVGNVGNPTILLGATLDGFNSPRSGFASNILYTGLPSELVVPSETLIFTCIADSSTSSAPEGGETWSVQGGTAYPLFDYHPEGSGALGSITTANASSTMLSNLNFTSFSNNSPTSWQITGGTPGTNILQETTNTFQANGSALKFAGDGTTTSIGVSQQVASASIKSRQLFCVTFQACRGGSAPGGGSLTISFAGSGYSPAPSEQINVGLAGLNGVYTLYKFYIIGPTNVPSNMTLNITANGTPAAGSFIYIDSGSCRAIDFKAGVSMVMVRGSIPASKGDQVKVPVSNNTAIFSNYSRQVLGVQLPSSTTGAQTISDALA